MYADRDDDYNSCSEEADDTMAVPVYWPLLSKKTDQLTMK